MERKEEGQPANPARKYSFEEDNYVPVPQQPTRRPELRPDSNLLNHLRRAPQDAVRHPQGNQERDREAAMVVTRTEMMEAKERFRGGQQKTATIPRSARQIHEDQLCLYFDLAEVVSPAFLEVNLDQDLWQLPDFNPELFHASGSQDPTIPGRI